MKTKIAIIILALGLTFSAKAQWVTIPDADFVYFLQNNYPTCMNGNQMDTTCYDITHAINLDCSLFFTISDLTGIEYFDSLRYLNCGWNNLTVLPPLHQLLISLNCEANHLTSLPVLPTTLIGFNCANNMLITSLPMLPASLRHLACYGNALTSLPALPISLTGLICSDNQLSSLPVLNNNLDTLWCYNNLLTTIPAIPNSLFWLDCANNQLTSLPSLNQLENLNCQHNQLSSLPTLNNPLNYIDCSNNLLTSLPAINSNLGGISCSNNQLTSLPILNNLYFGTLYCSHNLLASLPALPSSLTELDAGNNLLTSLPILPPYLRALWCDSNNISCFPVFPDSLNFPGTGGFDISNNPFTCLPNYVPSMDAATLAYPLCVQGDLTNNPNGCNSANGIVGHTYHDNNSNCIDDAGDVGFSHIPLKLYDSGNNLISQTYSLSNSLYDFADTSGTYTVKVDTLGMPFTFQCQYPGIDSTVVLTAGNPLANNVNFDVVCKPGFDLGVQSINRTGLVFPGIQHSLRINAGDISQWYNFNCAAGISGQVQVTVNGPASYYGIISGALSPSIAGNVFTYSIPDFGTINNSSAFGLVLTTDTTAQMGDSICVDVTVTPNAGDNNISNNTKHFCYGVFTSYDPNLKETYPMQVQPGFNDYFTYTIHFQNTGTASAMNIMLADTLDANLDLNTFQVINYSHPNSITLNGNKLYFRFNNINLPDSTTDFNGSQGYVQYRIKPLANLPAGTQIHNKASIYFDYNAPVVTNTTTNEYMLSINTSEIRSPKSEMSIYPNPSTGKFVVKLSEGTDVSKLSIEVTNVLGEIILQSKMHTSTGSVTLTAEIDLSNHPKGVYFIRVTGGEQAMNQRVVKQ